MKDAAELSRELNARWLEITQRVFALQERLLCAARGGREGAVIGRTVRRISSCPTGMAPVMSVVGLAPVVGSFSDSRFVSGLVQLRIHLLSASIASGSSGADVADAVGRPDGLRSRRQDAISFVIHSGG